MPWNSLTLDLVRRKNSQEVWNAWDLRSSSKTKDMKLCEIAYAKSKIIRGNRKIYALNGLYRVNWNFRWTLIIVTENPNETYVSIWNSFFFLRWWSDWKNKTIKTPLNDRNLQAFTPLLWEFLAKVRKSFPLQYTLAAILVVSEGNHASNIWLFAKVSWWRSIKVMIIRPCPSSADYFTTLGLWAILLLGPCAL